MTHFRRPLLAIARTTSVELASQPISMLTILAGLTLTALIPLLHFHEFGEPGRLARDGGFAYLLVIGTILGIFSAAGTLRGELDNGTALTTLGKPVSRNVFLLGKWLGALSLAVRFWIANVAVTMTATRISPRFTDLGEDGMRFTTDATAQLLILLVPVASLLCAAVANISFRSRFNLSAIRFMDAFAVAVLALAVLFDRQWHFAPSLSNADVASLSAALPILFAICANCAVASALAIRLPINAVAALSFGLLAAGLSWGSLTAGRPWLRLVPVLDLQPFWLCDAYASAGAIPPRHILASFIYAASIATFAICCGMLALRRREIN